MSPLRPWLAARFADDMRVIPVSGLTFRSDRAAAKAAKDLAGLERAVQDVVPADELAATVVRAGSSLSATAEAAATAARRYGVEEALSRTFTEDAAAFRNTTLMEAYRKWRRRGLPEWEDTLDRWVDANAGAPVKPVLSSDPMLRAQELGAWADELDGFARASAPLADPVERRTPFDFMVTRRTGTPPDVLLRSALGDDYRKVAREVAFGRRRANQPAALWPRLVASVWRQGEQRDLDRLARIISANPLTDPADANELIDLVLSVAEMTQVLPGRVDAEWTAEKIRTLMSRYAGENVDDLTADGVQELMGAKTLSSQAFIDRILISLSMMADQADLLGPDVFHKMLEVPAIESFFEGVVRRSGHEHGYAFEVFLVARELFLDLDPKDLWMQVTLGEKMGPDFARMIGTGAARRARLMQAKSYQDISALLRPTDTGEILRQVQSDLRRFKEQGFAIDGIPIDRVVDFKIDWWRIRTKSLSVEGFTEAQLRSLDPAVAAPARAAFEAQYVTEKVDEINALLADAGFMDELGIDPPPFSVAVELVDQVLLPNGDELIRSIE